MTLHAWPADVTDALAAAASPALQTWLLHETPVSHYADAESNKVGVAKAASTALERTGASTPLTDGLTIEAAIQYLHGLGAALDKAVAAAQKRITALQKAEPDRFSYGMSVTRLPLSDLPICAAVADAAFRLHDGATLVLHGLRRAEQAAMDALTSTHHGLAARKNDAYTFDRRKKKIVAAFNNLSAKLVSLIEASVQIWYSTAAARFTIAGQQSRASTGLRFLPGAKIAAVRTGLRSTLRALTRLYVGVGAKAEAATSLAWGNSAEARYKDYALRADWPDLSAMIFGERLTLTLDGMDARAETQSRQGMPVALYGFDRIYPETHAGELRTFAYSILDRYAKQAQRYMPALLRDPPRIQIWAYKVHGPEKTPGGHYYQRARNRPAFMVWYLSSYFATKQDPDTAVQTIAHEMAHHLWRSVLRKDQKDLWAKTVRADVTTFDFARLLEYRTKPWPPEAPRGWDALPPLTDLPDPAAFYAEQGKDLGPVYDLWRQNAQNDKAGVLGPYDYEHSDPAAIIRVSLQAAWLRKQGYDVSTLYTRKDDRGRSKVTAYIRKAGDTTYNAPVYQSGGYGFARSAASGTVNDALAAMKVHDPVLYLQTLIASSVYDPDYTTSGSAPWRWMNAAKGEQPVFHMTWAQVEAAKAQTRREVPRLPVTSYGATNAEEAWCDAVGNMVAYGPQAVLEPVRELVYALLPSFRRNPAEADPP